jgi:hypothetical protein
VKARKYTLRKNQRQKMLKIEDKAKRDIVGFLEREAAKQRELDSKRRAGNEPQ